MECLTCVFTENRKLGPNDPSKPVVYKRANLECCYDGCMIKFTDLRPILKKAKVGNRDYDFCCEYCYLEWLKMGVFRY